MYENEKYDRKKTAKLTAAVNGFARIIKAMETFSANMFDNCNSSLLKTLLRGSSAAKASSDGASAGTAGASVPDFSSLLEILRDIKARQNSSASSSDDPELAQVSSQKDAVVAKMHGILKGIQQSGLRSARFWHAKMKGAGKSKLTMQRRAMYHPAGFLIPRRKS